jgi:hypothetical protein
MRKCFTFLYDSIAIKKYADIEVRLIIKYFGLEINNCSDKDNKKGQVCVPVLLLKVKLSV